MKAYFPSFPGSCEGYSRIPFIISLLASELLLSSTSTSCTLARYASTTTTSISIA